MENKKLKFVVVGCGHIGKRHIAMILANPLCELVALVDPKSKEELKLETSAPPLFSSTEELIASNLDFDVANIATPNGLHAPIAFQLLQQHKHLVVEKPMTLTTQDADKMIALAKEKQCQVFVVKQNRYSPPVAWLKEIVTQNRLGELYMVQLSCYWNRDERYYLPRGWHGDKKLDGGTLFTQFSHFIDIMYWLFGDVKNIKSRFFDFNHQITTDFEDSGIVSFEFEQGGAGSLNFSTSVWDKNLESSMTIIGSKGSVKIGGQYMDKVEMCHIEDYEMPELEKTSAGNDYGTYKGSAANHHFVISNVIAVLNKQALPTATVLEGRNVVNIIERIYSSSAQ